MFVARLLYVVALIGTISSTVYTALALWAAFRFARKRDAKHHQHEASEPLSVLKPLHGEGLEIESNLLTFYQQSHREFELLFGVRRLDDPGVAVARRLATRFPHIHTRIIASGEPQWPNARAYSVNALVKAARHPTLVITDSDVRVAQHFLQSVADPLTDHSVGLVTCLYRGASSGGLWTDLEALGMSVELMSNVLIANMLNGMDFALGPATATNKRSIQTIGGLVETGAYYADDFALGNQMHRRGLRVILSDQVVEHVVPTSSLFDSFRRQVLWLKNNRFLRSAEHFGIGLTFSIPFALLGYLAMELSGKGKQGLIWLAWGLLNCIIRCIGIGWAIVRDPDALTKSWLYPLRDLLGFATWIATWFGNQVNFRGERYKLLRGGKIRRI